MLSSRISTIVLSALVLTGLAMASRTQAEDFTAQMTVVEDDIARGSNPIQNDGRLPKFFEVRQNYPNPFNATTIIEFDLPRETGVYAVIYNSLGHKIRTLENDLRSPGRYRLEWNGTNDAGNMVSSGVYFNVLVIDDDYAIHKMLLLK